MERYLIFQSSQTFESQMKKNSHSNIFLTVENFVYNVMKVRKYL